MARLQAGGGQVVARLEGISADRSRLLLEPGPNVAGEVVVRTGAEGPSCRGPDPASGLSSPATGEWLLALPAGGRPATLECSGDGPIHLEVRLDGRLQDTATITLGP